MKAIDYLRGWIAAAAVYIMSTLATSWLTAVMSDARPVETPAGLPDAALTPWLVPAALSAVAAVVAVRRKVRAEWWKWLVLTIAVPFAGGIVLGSLVLEQSIDAPALVRSVLVHVALAGVLGVSLGGVVTRVRAATQVLRR